MSASPALQQAPAAAPELHLVASFHYDVAYLETYEKYLGICFRNLDEALRILEREPDYHYLVEQVILLEEYWERFPGKRGALQKFAREGRLSAAPGMYVMPDLNLPDGESLFQQIRVGREWLEAKLGLEPTVCWIADCWGHHAQLPQILRQTGYDAYVFWRCMRRDVLRNDFIWKGMDGTKIRAHWLALGYASLRFPTEADRINEGDLNFVEADADQVRDVVRELTRYGSPESFLILNGGDFAFPQSSGPSSVRRMAGHAGLSKLRFSTLEQFLESVDWNAKPVVEGEFNSSLQGTFTSNIRIKQANRRLTNRLLSLETLAVCAGVPRTYDAIWRILLKQQFHDIICGTITDAALGDCLAEFEIAERQINEALEEFSGAETAWFNPCAFPRVECAGEAGMAAPLDMPGLGMAVDAKAFPRLTDPPSKLPCRFENEWYEAEIGADGHLVRLIEKASGEELVAAEPAPFGSLAMQIDNGDFWLNFQAPLSGGSLESSLTQNNGDPYDHSTPHDLVNRSTIRAQIEEAGISHVSKNELVVRQVGFLRFWQIRIPFETTIRLANWTPRIDYTTTVHPHGRNYRIRVAFPTALEGGTATREIPYGEQCVDGSEHAAQNWFDCTGKRAGLAVLNRGTAGSTVHDGILMQTLFRAVAMEYKAPSAAGYGEGVVHRFDYAILPHTAGASLIEAGQAYNKAPLRIGRELAVQRWTFTGPIFLSAMRWTRERHVFVRVFGGKEEVASACILPPAHFREAAVADGLQRTAGPWTDCSLGMTFALKPFEIAQFVFRSQP